MGFFDAITGLDVLKGGLGLVNGVLDRKAQKDMNAQNIALQRETNYMNERLMHEQNDFNRQMAIDMFNLENEYNTPEKQIERLRSAGLNPAMMMDNGQMVNNGDAMTPSASGTPQMVAPQTLKVPSLSESTIQAYKVLQEASLLNSQKNKADSETLRNYRMTEKELEALGADIRYKEAMTNYQNLQNSLDTIFSPFERQSGLKKQGEEIKYLASQSALNAIKGDTEKAMKLFYDAETAVSRIKHKEISEKLPLEIMNLKATLKLITAQTQTEKSKQTFNYSSSAYNRAMAKLHNISADLEERKRDWLTNRSVNEYGFPNESNLEKLFTYDMRQKVKNLSKTDKEMEKLSNEIENLFIMARKNSKDLDWYEVDKCWNMAMDFYKQNAELLGNVIPF